MLRTGAQGLRFWEVDGLRAQSSEPCSPWGGYAPATESRSRRGQEMENTTRLPGHLEMGVCHM